MSVLCFRLSSGRRRIDRGVAHPLLPCGNVRKRAFAQSGMCRPTRANRAVTSSQRHSAAVHLAVHPPAREAGYTETVDGESDAGSRSDCISGFNEGHSDQLCPATRRALATTLELSGLDKRRHTLPSLRACSTRADSSFHFLSALLARRCVSST